MLKSLSIALLSISLINLAQAKALTEREQLAECEELLVEAEGALDRADIVINTQADTITQLDAQNARLQRSLDYTMSELSSQSAWYRDPKYVAPLAFVLGVALGAYVVKGR